MSSLYVQHRKLRRFRFQWYRQESDQIYIKSREEEEKIEQHGSFACVNKKLADVQECLVCLTCLSHLVGARFFELTE